MPVYFMALVVPVEAPTPELAFSALNDPEDPNLAGEPVFCTNPFEGTQRMADDPDFDVPTIIYHGKPLPLAPSEWERAVHLTLPRGGNLCGAEGPGEAEHLRVTCEDCLAVHGAHEIEQEGQDGS